MNASRTTGQTIAAFSLVALTLFVAGVWVKAPHVVAAARVVPPPAVDASASANSEVAVLAGGCCWGVQGVFQHVKGVANAVSGYAGGDDERLAHYEAVGTGTTGHAESVQITFDPRQVTYGQLLRIFFSVAH